MAAITLQLCLDKLTSARGRAKLASAVFFGACSSLRNCCVNVEQFTRTIRNLEERFPERAAALRASPKFTEMTGKVVAAANKAAGVHAVAEGADVHLSIDFEPPLPKPTTKDEAQQLSDLVKGAISADVIAAGRLAAMEKKFGREMESADMASAEFWSAPAPVSDAFVKYDTLVGCLEREQLAITMWSKPDLAELAAISNDLEMICNWDTEYPDERLPEYTEDEQADKDARAEKRALDAFAAQQEAVRYLKAEQDKAKKASSAAKMRRVKKEDLAAELAK